MKVPVTSLGQCGFRLKYGATIVYIDPYLTNHVAEVEGEEMNRLLPVPIEPSKVTDADYVLVTHAHMDHCDLETLVPLSSASPKCQFVCPNEVANLLYDSGIEKNRVIVAHESVITIASQVQIIPVPAAHPIIETDDKGLLRCLGYVIEYEGRRFYHAGDGSPDDLVFDKLNQLSPIDVAFIPVNEKNFYRDKRGIIGNMSVREAFQMTTDIGVKTLIPTHWDMFALNSVYQEELNLLYELMNPPFEMIFNPEEL